MKPLSKQSGLSLIEIMVALVISLFLLGGIGQVYLGNNSAYRFTDAISRIQENGRFALDTITTDVRMAGFMGCIPVQSDSDGDGKLSDNNPKIQNHLNPANYTSGKYDFLDSPAITATNGANGLSDTLTLKGAKAGQSIFKETLSSPGSDPIKVDSSVSFNDNDIVLITNCFSANIFQIDTAAKDNETGITTLTHSTAGSSPGNYIIPAPSAIAIATATTPKPANPCPGGGHCLLNDTDFPYYANNAAAFDMQVVNYYIGVSDSGSGEPALRRVVNEDDEELIEGVEQMQLMFGIDDDVVPDDFPNKYVSPDQVPDMRKVKAIRIALLIRSDATGLTESNQTYQIFGTNMTANDTRLRQVFTSTISIRNLRN